MSRIAVVLVLPIEYNTSSMLRCRTIISALAEMGNEITCICPNPDKDNRYFSYEDINIPGVTLFRYGGKAWSETKRELEQNNKRSFKSSVKYIALKLFRKVDVFGSTLMYLPEKKRISDVISNGHFDILLSFSDPMPAHMIATYCKRHNPKLRYIQQWGDPLATDTISKTALPVWIRKWIEKKLLDPADKVCYVSPFTWEEQKKLFPKQADKMVFLPTPSLDYMEETIPSEKLCLGYFGSYNSVARDIRPFYEAAKRNPNVDFLIIGDSDLTLKSEKNITILQRIPQVELEFYMKKTNVIVCLMNSKGNQIPGKVYHDASSRKDILFIKDGEYGEAIQSFFDKYNHYTFVDNNVDSIDDAIKRYIAEGVPERQPVIDFQASNVAKNLIE